MARASLFQWTVVPVPRPSPHLAEGPGGVVPALETGQGLQIWVGRLAGSKPIGQGGHPPLCRPAMEVGHVRRQAEAHALGQPVGAQEEGAALVQGDLLPPGVGKARPSGVQDPVAPRGVPQGPVAAEGGLDPRQALPEGAPPGLGQGTGLLQGLAVQGGEGGLLRCGRCRRSTGGWRHSPPGQSTPPLRPAGGKSPPPPRGGRPGDRSTGPAAGPSPGQGCPPGGGTPPADGGPATGRSPGPARPRR